MRLAKLSEFRDLVYTPDSAPKIDTLRARIRRGKLPGGRIDDGHYYVDLDEYDAATKLRQGIADKLRELRNHPAMEGLL